MVAESPDPTRLAIGSLEAVPDFVGSELGPSSWVRVEQTRIDTFAEVTGDHQWIHCDPERAARDSPWKTSIAHGYLTLALVPALLEEILSIEGGSSVVNSGLEKLRFSAPVPSGSRVRLRAQLSGARPLPGGGVRVTLALRMEVEGQGKPALRASAHYVYMP